MKIKILKYLCMASLVILSTACSKDSSEILTVEDKVSRLDALTHPYPIHFSMSGSSGKMLIDSQSGLLFPIELATKDEYYEYKDAEGVAFWRFYRGGNIRLYNGKIEMDEAARHIYRWGLLVSVILDESDDWIQLFSYVDGMDGYTWSINFKYEPSIETGFIELTNNVDYSDIVSETMKGYPYGEMLSYDIFYNQTARGYFDVYIGNDHFTIRCMEAANPFDVTLGPIWGELYEIYYYNY